MTEKRLKLHKLESLSQDLNLESTKSSGQHTPHPVFKVIVLSHFQVIFKPRLSGLHTAQLHVTSSPVASDGQQSTESLPSLVALEAVAEQPDIEVLPKI